jgi:hypothetical protein
VARNSTGGVVAALTAAALAVVGFLGYQAAATAPNDLSEPHRNSASSTPKDEAKDKAKKPSTALPANSGTGLRVVYSLGAQRVWLVAADDQVIRTFKVAPSSVSPGSGAYTVTSRTVRVLGSDGVEVEDVVIFHTDGTVVFGFSAAVDGAAPNPDSHKKTGGIREAIADAAAMWKFAQVGTRVVVVS